jgi:pSer/pThr/pTyr-binding forkhead associated (FHA) protein
MIGMLHVVEGPDKGRCYPLPRGKKVLIGRAPTNLICLSDPKVSRVHCDVVQDGSLATLCDNGSAGGTWVNGERIEQRDLETGDVINLGDTQLSFQWTDSDERRTDAWSPSLSSP